MSRTSVIIGPGKSRTRVTVAQGKTYRFPPMLGPCDEWPAGSAEWALRFANTLSYTVRNSADYGVMPVIPLVVQAIEHRPWKVWPDPPAGSIDAFFKCVTGFDYKQIYALIHEYIRDEDLARKLAAAKGVDEKEIGQGARTDLQHRAVGTKLKRGSNNADHLLRRLARDHVAVLARYEKGEFKSVRAAAIAAGIIKVPTPLDALWRAWEKTSAADRRAFLKAVR